MVVPPQRNHRGGLAGRGESRNASLVASCFAGRASTSAVAKTTAGGSDSRPLRALLSGRLRRGSDIGGDALCGADAPTLRGKGKRATAGHQSGFVMRRTPPRHPPRGPPKIRQCRSRRPAAERFEAPLASRRARSLVSSPSERPSRRRFQNVPIGRYGLGRRVASRSATRRGALKRSAHRVRGQPRENSPSPVHRRQTSLANRSPARSPIGSAARAPRP